MKINYDPETDTLSIILNTGPVQESDEQKPGIVLDYDDSGRIIGIEILNASKQVENPMAIEYMINREVA